MKKKVVVAILFTLLLTGCNQNGDSANQDFSKEIGVSSFQNIQARRPFSAITPIEFTLANGRKHKFFVEIADTFEERKLGLMNQKSLAIDEGMLFVFDQPEELTFWMKNTLIPLDILFIDQNFKVFKIARSAQPCKTDPCMMYDSEKPARYVVEINGGLSDKFGIKEGTSFFMK